MIISVSVELFSVIIVFKVLVMDSHTSCWSSLPQNQSTVCSYHPEYLGESQNTLWLLVYFMKPVSTVNEPSQSYDIWYNMMDIQCIQRLISTRCIISIIMLWKLWIILNVSGDPLTCPSVASSFARKSENIQKMNLFHFGQHKSTVYTQFSELLSGHISPWFWLLKVMNLRWTLMSAWLS